MPVFTFKLGGASRRGDITLLVVSCKKCGSQLSKTEYAVIFVQRQAENNSEYLAEDDLTSLHLWPQFTC